MPLIDRVVETHVLELFKQYPVITITGPRQSGKTTLCKKIFPQKPYVNLEAPDIRQHAIDDPRGFLSFYQDGAIFDEIQRAPDLCSYLQGIVDAKGKEGLFILTGSQQFEVSNKINQSLAGRTALVKLLPFSFEEIRETFSWRDTYYLLYKGFYPRLWDKDLNPTQALRDYFETYVERDLRQLINIKNLHLFQRFVQLCAGRIGQILNLSSLANDTGISHTTASNWLSMLEASYICFLLRPYYRNLSKRIIRSPKLYFYDTGLACYLLGIENERQVARDPLLGSLFENLVITEFLKYRYNRGLSKNLYFYRDKKGHEVDLLLISGSSLFPVEIKAGMTVTKDYFKGLNYIEKAFSGFTIRGGAIIYAGEDVQVRRDIRVYPFKKINDLLNHAHNALNE